MWNNLKRHVQGLVTTLVVGEEGQGLVEYSLILAFVSIVSIAALTLLGGNISSLLNETAGKI